jgi:hypothetical protein
VLFAALPSSAADEWNGGNEAPSEALPSACIPASQCCKICDKGQACGNTCISHRKTCQSGRGCACNLSEVCSE